MKRLLVILTLMLLLGCQQEGEGQTLYTNDLVFQTNQFSIVRQDGPVDGYSVISIDSDLEGYHFPVVIGTVQCPWTNYSVPFSAEMPGTNIIMVSDVNSSGAGPAAALICTAPAVYVWFDISSSPSVGRSSSRSVRAVGPFIFQPGDEPAFWIGAVSKTDWNPSPYYTVEIVSTNTPPHDSSLPSPVAALVKARTQ